MPKIDRKLLNRFFQKVSVDATTGCWPWTAGMHPAGYGCFKFDGRVMNAHRASYMMFVGDPGRLHIDHLCRNRACVNPAHLEAVSLIENIARGQGPSANTIRKGRCMRDLHAFTPDNTIVRPNGKRECRACCRAAKRAWSARRPPEQRSADNALVKRWREANPGHVKAAREADREHANERSRERYATDPDYRARKLAAAKANHERRHL